MKGTELLLLLTRAQLDLVSSYWFDCNKITGRIVASVCIAGRSDAEIEDFAYGDGVRENAGHRPQELSAHPVLVCRGYCQRGECGCWAVAGEGDVGSG